MSQTHDQQRFTISEVVADWHEPTYTTSSTTTCIQLGRSLAFIARFTSQTFLSVTRTRANQG